MQQLAACASQKMSNVGLSSPPSFPPDVRAAFTRLLSEKPSTRRVSVDSKQDIITWLINPHKRPCSQEEFSRRNYVRRNFTWDENTRILFTTEKDDKQKPRVVITTDAIIDIVENTHEMNGHAGWDATWKDINNSYYGILRSDVNFLLKTCRVCAQNPIKRPKASASSRVPSDSAAC